MNYSTSKETFKFKKPETWVYMPMYKKISYYKTTLDHRYTPYVDKLMAKEIVKHLCGDRIKVATVARILKDSEDFHEDDLQRTDCILKTTHASGWNLNITSSTTVEEAKKLLKSWNKVYVGANEKHYSFLQPRFFLEEKVHCAFSGTTGNARTFMFRCVNGSPISIGVRQGSEQTTYYPDRTPVEKIKVPLELNNNCLERMIHLAKVLSGPFEFVRTDFYLSDTEDIYFSEFTFTPAGGTSIFPPALEKKFGALWK